MKNKKTFIIKLLIGIIIMGIGLKTHFDYYSTFIFAIGFSFVFSSIISEFYIFYWQNPKRKDKYEAKKYEEHINRIDERKQYLRMKAGYITYQIMILVLILISFLLSLFQVEAWITAMVFLLFVLQFLIQIILYRIFEKRM